MNRQRHEAQIKRQKVQMEKHTYEIQIDNNILRVFGLLFHLGVVKGPYNEYGLSWIQRQRYIDTQLALLDLS